MKSAGSFVTALHVACALLISPSSTRSATPPPCSVLGIYPEPFISTQSGAGPGPVVTFPGANGVAMLAAGDWLLPGSNSRGVVLPKSNGNGSWEETQNFKPGYRNVDIAVGEVTGDSLLDLVVASEVEIENLVILRQDTPGHYGPIWRQRPTAPPEILTVDTKPLGTPVRLMD